MSNAITVSTAQFPTGYCPGSLAEAWPFLVSLLSAQIQGGNSLFNYGPNTPAPEDRDKPWFRTESSGRPDALYAYADGVWLSKHPLPPGVIIIYRGAVGTIDTFDGGETATVTETTGPFWARVTQLDARFALGIGTLEDATVVNIDDTGGKQRVTLAGVHIPAHTHALTIGAQGNPLLSSNIITYSQDSTSGHVNKSTDVFGGDTDGNTTPHQNMPPWSGVLHLYRTARLYQRRAG